MKPVIGQANVRPKLTYPSLSAGKTKEILGQLRALRTRMFVDQGRIRDVFDACYLIDHNPEGSSDRAVVESNFPHDGAFPDAMITDIKQLLSEKICPDLPPATR